MAYLDFGVLVAIGEEARLASLLTLLTVGSIRSAVLTTAVQEALTGELGQVQGVELNTWTIRDSDGSTLHLKVQVQTAGQMTEQEVLSLRERITGRLQCPLTVCPVSRCQKSHQPWTFVTHLPSFLHAF